MYAGLQYAEGQLLKHVERNADRPWGHLPRAALAGIEALRGCWLSGLRPPLLGLHWLSMKAVTAQALWGPVGCTLQ